MKLYIFFFKYEKSSTVIQLTTIFESLFSTNSSKKDETAENSVDLLKEIVTAVRMMRSQMNVTPGKKADLIIWEIDKIEEVSYLVDSTPIRNVLKNGSEVFTA